MDKPLPDRVRPLEGAGMVNLYGDMGVERRRWRYVGPISALCIAAGIVVLAAVGIGL